MRRRAFLRGQEYATKTWKDSARTVDGNLYSQITNTHLLASFDYGTDLVGWLNYVPGTSGRWHSFSFVSETLQTNYDEGVGNWASTSKRTTYEYDPSYQSDGQQYGNPTGMKEYDAAGNLLRYSTSRYATRVLTGTGAVYIVDRKINDAVRSPDPSNGNLLKYIALTHYAYDGSTNLAELTKGSLSLVRKYYNVPYLVSLDSTIISGTDMTYGYDSIYGNQTSQSTYENYGRWDAGTSLGLPGSGSPARTQTTIYDNTFNRFPTKVTYPQLASGLVLSQTVGYDYRMGTMTSATDFNGNVTQADYDKYGRPQNVVKPGDSFTAPTMQARYFDGYQPFRYMYTEREQPGLAGGDRKRHSHLYYDGLGRQVQAKRESCYHEVCTSPGVTATNIVVDYKYDGLGQRTFESQPRYLDGGTNPQDPNQILFFSYQAPTGTLLGTNFAYDTLGRQTVITAADGTKTNMYYYMTGSGPASTMVDANGHKTRSESDLFGRLRNVQEYSGTSSLNYSLYATSVYTYTPLDLLQQVRDNAGNISTMSYDTLGRKTSMTDPDMGGWSYSYDPNGNLKSQLDAKSQTISFTYDKLDRLVQKGYSTGEAPSTYTYDENANGLGQRTNMIRSSYSTKLRYDARGNITETTHLYPTGVYTYRTAYDSGERVVTATLPNGEGVAYTYDEAWRQIKACGSVCYVTATNFTALDQPTVYTMGNGLQQRWSYDPLTQRVKQIRGTG